MLKTKKTALISALNELEALKEQGVDVTAEIAEIEAELETLANESSDQDDEAE